MLDILNLDDRHILIIGAASGIGRETAIILSKHGATLTLVSRRESQLQETLLKLNNRHKHQLFPIDVTDYSLIEKLISSAVEKSGKFSGLIYSAGIDTTRPLSSLKSFHYESSYAVNTIAAFELAKIVSKKKYLDSNTNCSFVFISSIAGVIGESAKIAYSSSKGALIAGTKSMAIELAPKNIRVNCISPAVIETEMSLQWINKLSEDEKRHLTKQHPLGLGKVADIAYASLFLLSEASVWITGTNIIIDGGYSAKSRI